MRRQVPSRDPRPSLRSVQALLSFQKPVRITADHCTEDYAALGTAASFYRSCSVGSTPPVAVRLRRPGLERWE